MPIAACIMRVTDNAATRLAFSLIDFRLVLDADSCLMLEHVDSFSRRRKTLRTALLSRSELTTCVVWVGTVASKLLKYRLVSKGDCVEGRVDADLALVRTPGIVLKLVFRTSSESSLESRSSGSRAEGGLNIPRRKSMLEAEVLSCDARSEKKEGGRGICAVEAESQVCRCKGTCLRGHRYQTCRISVRLPGNRMSEAFACADHLLHREV